MIGDFFNWLDLDQISFWIGFLIGIIFLWVLRRARPVFRLAGVVVVDRFHRLRENLTASTEIRLRADVLKHVQKRHLAHPFCALDEIVIPPKILLPAPNTETNPDTQQLETVESLIPFLPEFPSISAAFSYPPQPIASIFQRGADILLLGNAGTGKTVALAYLASQLARKDHEFEYLSDALPIFIDAVDLLELHNDQITPFDLCHAVISRYASTMTQARLAQLLKIVFRNGKAFLIVDGVDELAPDQVQLIGEWLQTFKSQYPHNRLIVAASPANHKDLLALDLHPAGLIGWDRYDKRELFGKWQRVWSEIVHNQPLNPFNSINELILGNWLANSPYTETPFTFTLRLWALLAGDVLGPNEITSIEAYIRRALQDYPEARAFLSKFAYRLLVDMKPSLKRRELLNLVTDTVPSLTSQIEPPVEDLSTEEQGTENKKSEPQATTASPSARIITSLISNGILREVAGDAITLSNILLTSYLVCEQYLTTDQIHQILEQPRWEGRQNSLWFLQATQDTSVPLLEYLDQIDPPLDNNLAEAGIWLQFAHPTTDWTSQTLRLLASLLQNSSRSQVFRFRILGALAACENKGIDVLFRRMLIQPDPETRLLGSFGCGLMQEFKALPELQKLLLDPDFRVRKAACLALGAIGGAQAIEIIAMGLLQTDEELQKCAAEMLATDQQEGYATLQEGAEYDDLLVRRAVVYGLKKINMDWSTELLAKMQLEDPQWIVRNAAEQALEQQESLPRSIPDPLPKLMNTPWIIEFAGEQGLGISSDPAAVEMLIQALQNGDMVQQEKALYRIRFLKEVSTEAIAFIYALFFGVDDSLREQAYMCLWYLSGRHTQLPDPVQFGYR